MKVAKSARVAQGSYQFMFPPMMLCLSGSMDYSAPPHVAYLHAPELLGHSDLSVPLEYTSNSPPCSDLSSAPGDRYLLTWFLPGIYRVPNRTSENAIGILVSDLRFRYLTVVRRQFQDLPLESLVPYQPALWRSGASRECDLFARARLAAVRREERGARAAKEAGEGKGWSAECRTDKRGYLCKRVGAVLKLYLI